MKTTERAEARRLRANGWSIKEIEEHLSVSRSSVSLWVRDVELGEAQRQRLIDRVRLGPIVSGERRAAGAREARRIWQEEGRQRAQERDPSYVAGCMLFWAEGSKKRTAVKLTNSDPELLVCFVRFLREHFDFEDSRLKVACNLFADHLERQREIEAFWLERLELGRESLRASTVNTYSKYSQKKRINMLPYGTTAVVLHDTRIAQTLYGSIQELAGFDRPEWLD